ncbi:hypothetical protein LC55x_1452 [Lysobacter capsici]|nr:hypothetical protein LC55x_1452 [Lysobacter capsici]
MPDLRAAVTGLDHAPEPIGTECVLSLQSQPKQSHVVWI